MLSYVKLWSKIKIIMNQKFCWFNFWI